MDEWTIDRIRTEFIDTNKPENAQLEYKSAGALGKQNDKRLEITKDVSALANSDGGIIVYGIEEGRNDRNGVTTNSVSPIDAIEFPKEWLEQIINTIDPIVPGLLIHPVYMDDSHRQVLYLVDIPRSVTVHQARDNRYYRRYNFQCLAMTNTEIQALRSRQSEMDLNLEFDVFRPPSQTSRTIQYHLTIQLENCGNAITDKMRLKMRFPNWTRFHAQLWGVHGARLDMVDADPALSLVEFNINDEPVALSDDRMYFVGNIDLSDSVFPGESIRITPEYIQCTYYITDELFRVRDRMPPVEWELYADNMMPMRGEISFTDLAKNF